MSENNSFSIFDRIPYPENIIKNKKENARYYTRTTLARLTEMFEYDGLPDSMPKRYMLLQLFTNGNIFITDKTNDNGLMSFVGGWGSYPNGYYVPTRYIVNNPYVNVDKTFEIDKDGVLILNDSQAMGLLPIVCRYSELLAENDISLRIASINTRRRTLANAPDDNIKLAFDKYLKDIEDGELGSAITGGNEFIGSLMTAPDGFTTSSSDIISIIELQQYTRATMFHELGLNANYNMKREAIGSNESQLNRDALYPLVDDMLNEQRIGWEKVNKMFGTNISVRLSSSWRDNELEKAAELEILENNSNQLDGDNNVQN